MLRQLKMAVDGASLHLEMSLWILYTVYIVAPCTKLSLVTMCILCNVMFLMDIKKVWRQQTWFFFFVLLWELIERKRERERDRNVHFSDCTHIFFFFPFNYKHCDIMRFPWFLQCIFPFLPWLWHAMLLCAPGCVFCPCPFWVSLSPSETNKNTLINTPSG